MSSFSTNSKRASAPGPLSHGSSSDSSSTVKVSSPLNPKSPKSSPTPPSRTPPGFTPAAVPETNMLGGEDRGVRPRAKSTSTVRAKSPTRFGFHRTSPSSSSPHPAPSPPAQPERALSASSSAGARSRSRSPAPVIDRSLWRMASKTGAMTPPNAPPQTWWGHLGTNEKESRPWHDSPKRKKTVPEEQKVAWLETRERVIEAVRAIVGTALEVTHEALSISVDALEFAPVPGLESAARALLEIWDAMQRVDMNRMACLRLIERCADILISIRLEIKEAGVDTTEELAMPLKKLTEAFDQVFQLLVKQINRPFLKRYLKRDEIQRDIQFCDGALTEALGLFSIRIQIRILKTVQANERRREAETKAIMDAIAQQAGTPPDNLLGLVMEAEKHGQDLPAAPPPSYPGLPPSPTTPTSSSPVRPSVTNVGSSPSHFDSPEQVREALRALCAAQNEVDNAYDARDLRQLMRMALQAGNDADMIEVLQVGRDEMPEAMKTLQRALEREVERESAPTSAPGMMRRGISEQDLLSHHQLTESMQIQRDEERFGTIGSLGGASLRDSEQSMTSTEDTMESSWSRVGEEGRDTLDREFIEGGIEALRRMSNRAETLPSWTITKYEVDRDKKIGMGYFSDVYRGRWRDRTVAIKVLAPTTPRNLFVHEIAIWKKLEHANVQKLYGASSASGDPPWFFVSPYYKNGSLVQYLKGLESLSSVNVLKMIHEISKGMDYLHGKGVLHGDLKAANVLVDDRIHCIISDFGQSEMKSEASRITGTPPAHGTLRWQPPEVISGMSPLAQSTDVYAFAMCCYEILTKGGLPWPNLDDDGVRHVVLKEDRRPALPVIRVKGPELTALIQRCWATDPNARPAFLRIAKEMRRLSKSQTGPEDSPTIAPRDSLDEPRTQMSPDPRPIALPDVPEDEYFHGVSPSSNSALGVHGVPGQWSVPTPDASQILPPRPQDMRSTSSSRQSSLSTTDTGHATITSRLDIVPVSPPPQTTEIADARDERRYRMMLRHDFHASLTLPLWSPDGSVELGAIGYLSKPSGSFTMLFNAFSPDTTSGGRAVNIPRIEGYGSVKQGSVRRDLRNVAQRGLDAISGLLSFGGSQPMARQYSRPLQAGHKMAWFLAETTIYRYMDSLDAPKKWFRIHIDPILDIYRREYPLLQREDIYLVVGCLDASNYAQFISHSHPDGQAHFNVFQSPKADLEWGTFSTDHDTGIGPDYGEDPIVSDHSRKVSKYTNGRNWDTVMLARLRFKPDSPEPTSLP